MTSPLASLVSQCGETFFLKKSQISNDVYSISISIIALVKDLIIDKRTQGGV